MTAYLGSVAYVNAKVTIGPAVRGEDVVEVRSVADDAIDVDGKRTPWPIPEGTTFERRMRIAALHFAFRPTDTIERMLRTITGVRAGYASQLYPKLGGRVSVKFVIDRTGSVTVAQDSGSDMKDAGVVSCVVRAFSTLAFPQPEGGVVTVVYPLIFTPGE